MSAIEDARQGGGEQPRTIVLTGASSGIGAAAARSLTARGHRVVLVGRSPARTAELAAELRTDSLTVDFTRLDDVRRLASELAARYPRIDVLANNAGGLFGPDVRTVDGFGTVNHLAPFLLTNLLLPTLLRSRATVIQTASDAARLLGRLDLDRVAGDPDRSPTRLYGDSKLANILMTRELHRRFSGEGISTAAFHPGAVATRFATSSTNLIRHLYGSRLAPLLLRSPQKGAEQLTWLAGTPAGDAWRSGEYYEKGRVAQRVNPQVRDRQLASLLGDASAARVGVAATTWAPA